MSQPIDADDLPRADEMAFLAGGGATGALVRAFDWSATPLGPPATWPQSLRTAVCLVLHARQPMFLAWGPALTLLYNDEYAVVLGAKHPRALGQDFASAWSDIWPQFGPLVRRVMSGEAISFEDLPIPMRRNDYPEETWFSFSYTPIHDETDSVAGLFCACMETTGKVRAEQQLRVAADALTALNGELERRVEERTRDRDRMWRLSTDIMLVADLTSRIQSVNPAWSTLLGWTQEELLGTDFLRLVHPEDIGRTRAELRRLAAGATTLRFENRYRRKDGIYRWLSWTAVPDERFIHAVGRDVQAEKEGAEALRRTEDELRQAQKMEAIGQLTGGLAHDFNNLLMGISGNIELVRIRAAQGRTGDLDRYLGAALGAAERAAALTHRLLAFSRRQTLDPRPTQANQLIIGMEELIRRSVGPEIRIETKLAVGLWPTLCDPNQLESALLNLCINARDAMPHGGQLTIETSNTWLDELGALERGMEPGQYVTICVIDSGTGMEEAVKARAFDPFFTTKPIGLGTGLGLSMVYGFVRQSGGQTQIISEPGQGTTICLHLPRFWGELGEEEPGEAAPEAPRASSGETVLVVDDEASVRTLITEVLEELGYAAITAADGASGLELLRSPQRIDLLISDVGLPGGMNGRQLADAARMLRPELRILFITGYAEQAAFPDGRIEPGMHVMTKPFAMDAMAVRIKEIISG